LTLSLANRPPVLFDRPDGRRRPGAARIVTGADAIAQRDGKRWVMAVDFPYPLLALR